MCCHFVDYLMYAIYVSRDAEVGKTLFELRRIKYTVGAVSRQKLLDLPHAPVDLHHPL